MKADYYKIYTRTDTRYTGPVIVKTMEELLKRKFIKNNYLIIGHNKELDADFNIILEELHIEEVEDLKTTTEVKTYTFKPKELQKESKAKKKQELYNLTKEYIDK